MSDELNKLIVKQYREYRKLGHSQSNAKRTAAVHIAMNGYCSVSEALAKLDYELSRANLAVVLGDLI